MNYRWCGVPECGNTSIKTPHKMFLHVPIKPHVRDKWLQAAHRDAAHLSPLSRMHFCEDHFDLEKDMLNHMEMSMTGSVKRIRLREGCLPSKFDCQSGKTTISKGKTTSKKPRSAMAKRRITAGSENDGYQIKTNRKREMDSESSSSDERCKEAAARGTSQQDNPSPAIKTEPPTDDEPMFPVPESTSTQYVLKGKRFVNVGYLIKSLQKLNDHGGRDCNFSDMNICGETKEGWNIGVELSCRICSTTAVVWMEDPDAKLIKTRPNLLQTAIIPQAQPQTTSIVWTQPQIYPTKVKKKKPHPRKTPTPPPDNPVSHFLVPLPLARSVNLPLVNPPQTTPFIKQEVIHGPSVSSVPPSSSTKPAAVQLLFFVDQPTSSQPVPTSFASTATTSSSVENITVTPDIFMGSEQYSSTSFGTGTISENITVTPDIYPADDVLPVDLDLVKKEVDDEPLGDGRQSADVNDKPGVCLVPMSETSLDPSQKLFALDNPKSPTKNPEASCSASDIKISSVTSCTKTSATGSETSTTLSETAGSNVSTVSCTPTFPIVIKVPPEEKQGSKE